MSSPAIVAPQARRLGLGLLPKLTFAGVSKGAAGTAVVGAIVLLGWWLNLDALKSMWPGLLTMKANTALCFLLMGTGTMALARPASALNGHRAGNILVAAAGAVAVATLAQYVTGRDFGIDQLLFREAAGQIGTVVAGRMAPMTGACFTLLAVAAIVRNRLPRLVLVLCGVALALAALNVFDFVFDAHVPTILAGQTQMAVNTALTVGVLSIAIVGLLGAANPFSALAGASTTAFLFRRLMAVCVFVPVVLAWLRLEGERLGLYDTSYGTSLMLVGVLALDLVALFRLAGWATRIEARRSAVELERDRFFDLTLDLLVVFDTAGRFQKVNNSWERLLGYPPGALIGRSLFDLLHPDDLEGTIAASQRHFVEGEAVIGFQNRYRHLDGSYRWLEWTSRMSPDLSVAYAVARDVTDRRQREDRRGRRQRILETQNDKLTEQAIRDPLTRLNNRRYFNESVPRLERRWRSAQEAGDPTPIAVILFDLDDFGQVNKEHGHQAGDAVLREFGRMLEKRFRGKDVVARYGGEEFVAILEGATSADAVRVADEIRVDFAGLAIEAGTENPLRVTVSAGCAEVGVERDIAMALTLADVWLSQAKRAGRNQVVGI